MRTWFELGCSFLLSFVLLFKKRQLLEKLVVENIFAVLVVSLDGVFISLLLKPKKPQKINKFFNFFFP